MTTRTTLPTVAASCVALLLLGGCANEENVLPFEVNPPQGTSAPTSNDAAPQPATFTGTHSSGTITGDYLQETTLRFDRLPGFVKIRDFPVGAAGFIPQEYLVTDKDNHAWIHGDLQARWPNHSLKKDLSNWVMIERYPNGYVATVSVRSLHPLPTLDFGEDSGDLHGYLRVDELYDLDTDTSYRALPASFTSDNLLPAEERADSHTTIEALQPGDERYVHLSAVAVNATDESAWLPSGLQTFTDFPGSAGEAGENWIIVTRTDEGYELNVPLGYNLPKFQAYDFAGTTPADIGYTKLREITVPAP